MIHNRPFRRGLSIRIAFPVVVFVVAGPMLGAAVAFQWKAIPVTNVQFVGRSDVFSSGKFEGDEQIAQFTDYYTKFFLPRFTQPKFRGRVPYVGGSQTRTDLLRDLRNELTAAAKPQSKDVYLKLGDIVVKTMTEYAGDSAMHPAVRYTAVLAIGEVNSRDAASTLEKMVKARFTDASLDSLRVAAMVGLARLADAGVIEGDTSQAVTKTMMVFCGIPSRPGPRAQGFAWMRGQAAEVLGLLKSPGPNGEIVTAIMKVVSDNGLPIAERCKAAAALGLLTLEGSNLPTGGHLEILRALAHDVVAAEKLDKDDSADRLRELRTKTQVESVITGLKSIGSKAKDNADRQVTEKAVATLTDLSGQLDDAKMTSEAYSKAIAKTVESLDSIKK